MISVRIGQQETLVSLSNNLPCSAISEKMVEILGLEKLPLKRSRTPMVVDMMGEEFGGSRAQCYFVRELVCAIDVTSTKDDSPSVLELKVGPLLVLPDPLTPLMFDINTLSKNKSYTMSQHHWTFRESLGGVQMKKHSVDGFYGPDPNNPTPQPLFGSTSFTWHADVVLAQCAQCNFEFPHLKICSRCEQVRYCSKACQRSHWKVHKKECNNNN
jgi:hypothetical protein